MTDASAGPTDERRAARPVIRAGIGPLATVVNGTSTGKSSARERTSTALTIVASASVVSSSAKCSPMHDRGPPANGTNCQRPRRAEASGPNRSGSKTSGSSHSVGIAVHGLDPHGDDAARLDAVAVDLDVLQRQPADPGRGRAQPQRLVQHLTRVPEPGHVVGRQFAVAELGDLRGDPVRRWRGWRPSSHSA